MMIRVGAILAMSFAGNLLTTPAQAGERGLTNYLAGYYGDFAVAVQPAQGIYTYATGYHYSATSDGASSALTLNLDGSLAITGFQYVTPWKVIGAQVAFAGYTTYLQGRLASDGGKDLLDKGQGFGDSSISPLVLYWKSGTFHVSFYESIILPTGSFEAASAFNTSRNYISFDTVMALTWLDPRLGLEISIVPGLMINTTNPATEYRTGAELHVDGMLNIYPARNIGFGLHGFLYSQLESDEVGGQSIGLRSRSMGVGPAILLIPPSGQGKIVGKWLHEVEGANRFQGDIVSLTAVMPF